MLACVVLAHTDPVHVRRLVRALEPFPVFLHCDARTGDDVVAEMTRDLPGRCTLLPRLPTPWARWALVAAELSGYRAVLEGAPDATHVAVLSGSDYPLMSTERISDVLADLHRRSVLVVNPLPYAEWGRSGGFSRLRYPHSSIGRHIIRTPVPRRLPEGVAFAGGSALKLLARHHVESVVRVTDSRPDLTTFWKRTWVADETFVPSVLNTPAFVPDWALQHVQQNAWYMQWRARGQQSPSWLGARDLPARTETLRPQVLHPARHDRPRPARRPPRGEQAELRSSGNGCPTAEGTTTCIGRRRQPHPPWRSVASPWSPRCWCWSTSRARFARWWSPPPS